MTTEPRVDKIVEQLFITRIRHLCSPLEPTLTDMPERLTSLQKIRAILFDVYGTLFISGAGNIISIVSEMNNQQACTQALQLANFSGNLKEAGIRGSEGLIQAIRRTQALRQQEGIEYPEVEIRQVWQTVLLDLQEANLIEGNTTLESVSRVSIEYECRVNPIWPMPETLSTLQKLRQEQFMLGIVSNAQFYTPLMFPALLGKTHKELEFEPNLCAWSYQIRELKPSTKMFQGVVEHLEQAYGITPQETLYVGNDMLNDVWAASQYGLKTALFAGDQRSLRLRKNDMRCVELEPDVIITKLFQLLKVID